MHSVLQLVEQLLAQLEHVLLPVEVPSQSPLHVFIQYEQDDEPVDDPEHVPSQSPLHVFRQYEHVVVPVELPEHEPSHPPEHPELQSSAHE